MSVPESTSNNYTYFKYTHALLDQVISTECTFASTAAKIAAFTLLPVVLLAIGEMIAYALGVCADTPTKISYCASHVRAPLPEEFDEKEGYFNEQQEDESTSITSSISYACKTPFGLPLVDVDEVVFPAEMLRVQGMSHQKISATLHLSPDQLTALLKP